MSSQNPNPRKRTPVPGHPGLYDLPNGKCQVRFRDETGKVRDRTFANRTLAIRAKGKVAAGDKRADSRMSFRRYADEWIKTYRGRKAGGASAETRDSYAETLRTQAIPFFGTVKLDRIDPPRLKRYVAHLEAKGYAPATIRRYFAPVRALLADAYDDGLLAHPVNIRVVLENAQERPRRQLTAEDTVKLLEQIPAEQADVALLFATTGARLSEPFGLRYRDLGHDDDGHPVVRFPRSKTAAGLKPIRLTPAMSQALTRRRAEQDAGPDDLVFPSVRGKERTGRSWRRRHFNPAAERAGIPWATPHMLRHGVATLMAQAGAEPYDIARMLRHADGGRLAQQTYVHNDAPDVAYLDAAFRPANPTVNPTNNPTTPQTSANGRQP
jgi:integrase